MMRIVLRTTLTIVFLLGYCVSAQHHVASTQKLELPVINKTELIIHHTGFSLSYNKIHKQANWVAYALTKEETVAKFKRSNAFKPDPKVDSKSAQLKDYAKSGYDRGHLAPAADMAWSAASMAESFYLSNISPQHPSFNRGVWKRAEELVRRWANEEDTVYVVTGPILTNKLTSIGLNKVSIPLLYYKVILQYSTKTGKGKGIALIIPNQASSKDLKDFTYNIDWVESITGINFFPALNDSIEEKIESTVDTRLWNWN